MKTLKINKNRFTAILCSFSFIVVQPTLVLADPVDYTFAFDPITLLTTISNSPTSSSAFDFYTALGPDAFTPLGLAPGDSVTIDQSGNVTGSFLDYKPVCTNKVQHITQNTWISNGNASASITITTHSPNGGCYELKSDVP